MRDLPKLRNFLRDWLRFRLMEPIRYRADTLRASLAKRAPVKMLLLGDQGSYTSEQQFAPLLASRNHIREQLGVIFRRQLLADALAFPRLLQQYDVVGFKLFFRTSAADALRVTRTLKSALAPGAHLVYFDGDDDLCIQWPELLPLVDAYVKKHCFIDRAEYQKNRIGKSNLTDYVARNFGVSFADDIIPTSAPVDAAQLDKIVAAWNIGLDDKIRRLYDRQRVLPRAPSKDVDIVCRATVNMAICAAIRRDAQDQLDGRPLPRADA
jgi:SAM-dependent methyltransferase